MRARLELPQLSLAERDRRYAAVRKQMAARGLDAIVLWGWPMMWDFYTANARYLSPIGGNAEFNVLIFPASGRADVDHPHADVPRRLARARRIG